MATRPATGPKRIIKWMQEFVDGALMDMAGSAELEGSAYAGMIQRTLQAFVGSAERELGIVLETYGDLDRTYWTPQQNNGWHRAQASAAERRATAKWKRKYEGMVKERDDQIFRKREARRILTERACQKPSDD